MIRKLIGTNDQYINPNTHLHMGHACRYSPYLSALVWLLSSMTPCTSLASLPHDLLFLLLHHDLLSRRPSLPTTSLMLSFSPRDYTAFSQRPSLPTTSSSSRLPSLPRPPPPLSLATLLTPRPPLLRISPLLSPVTPPRWPSLSLSPAIPRPNLFNACWPQHRRGTRGDLDPSHIADLFARVEEGGHGWLGQKEGGPKLSEEMLLSFV